MNGWKEFKIDDLPGDILTGDYEFTWNNPSGFGSFKTELTKNRLSLIGRCDNNKHLYYRKPEPKQPSHEEIMIKWWNHDNEWLQVQAYVRESDDPYYVYNKGFSRLITVRKNWFIGRESATIPPER